MTKLYVNENLTHQRKKSVMGY